MPDTDQPFPCPPWCSGSGCTEHLDQAVVHRETPEAPLIPRRDPDQVVFVALEQHDDPHGIQPGEPFGVIGFGDSLAVLDPDELGWLSEQMAAARLRLLRARGEPVVPIRRGGRHDEGPRR